MFNEFYTTWSRRQAARPDPNAGKNAWLIMKNGKAFYGTLLTKVDALNRLKAHPHIDTDLFSAGSVFMLQEQSVLVIDGHEVMAFHLSTINP